MKKYLGLLLLALIGPLHAGAVTQLTGAQSDQTIPSFPCPTPIAYSQVATASIPKPGGASVVLDISVQEGRNGASGIVLTLDTSGQKAMRAHVFTQDPFQFKNSFVVLLPSQVANDAERIGTVSQESDTGNAWIVHTLDDAVNCNLHCLSITKLSPTFGVLAQQKTGSGANNGSGPWVSSIAEPLSTDASVWASYRNLATSDGYFAQISKSTLLTTNITTIRAGFSVSAAGGTPFVDKTNGFVYVSGGQGQIGQFTLAVPPSYVTLLTATGVTADTISGFACDGVVGGKCFGQTGRGAVLRKVYSWDSVSGMTNLGNWDFTGGLTLQDWSIYYDQVNNALGTAVYTNTGGVCWQRYNKPLGVPFADTGTCAAVGGPQAISSGNALSAPKVAYNMAKCTAYLSTAGVPDTVLAKVRL